MKHTNLAYIGVLKTPSGTFPFWDTGRRLTPVELAEIAGLQTAVANARTRKDRRAAQRHAWRYIEALSERVSVWAPSASITCTDDGRVLINLPEYDDERPVPISIQEEGG